MSSLFGTSKRRRTAAVATTGAVVAGGDDQDEHSPQVVLDEKRQDKKNDTFHKGSLTSSFAELGLSAPLIATCKALGFKRPSPVQRTILPQLLLAPDRNESHILALAATGSGKTAAFCLPILQTLAQDPYGIFALILTPTRELAQQIQEQVQALGSSLKVKSVLVVGGMDQVRQSCQLDRRPHVVVATPGRLAELLRGANPPRLNRIRYCVLDEADRLLDANSGFQRDVAEILLHSTYNSTTTISTTPQDNDEATKNNENHSNTHTRRRTCQTLLFSATLTKSLESIEEMAGGGVGRLPLKKFVIRDDNGETSKKRKLDKSNEGKDADNSDEANDDNDDDDLVSPPSIPTGLKQEYIFMPSHVRDAYLLTTIRALMTNGGRRGGGEIGEGWNDATVDEDEENLDIDENEDGEGKKARSAIIFVSTCQRAAKVHMILTELGIPNVCLHSLLTQNRRTAALGKFKSQQVRILVATDVASRGLDIPSVDLVINSELPRRPVDYIHRVGRTARAGRRGRAISLVGERDVALVQAAEQLSGRPLEKCDQVTDDMAVQLLGPITKAARLAKMKLMDIGFDELVKKMKDRKTRDRRDRQRAERAAKKAAIRASQGSTNK